MASINAEERAANLGFTSSLDSRSSGSGGGGRSRDDYVRNICLGSRSSESLESEEGKEDRSIESHRSEFDFEFDFRLIDRKKGKECKV
jgi:hypothetical protein